MFVSRCFGRAVTSVQVRPVATTLWGLLFLAFGIMFLVLLPTAPTPGAVLACLVFGAGMTLAGCVGIRAGTRQIRRGVRTFFS